MLETQACPDKFHIGLKTGAGAEPESSEGLAILPEIATRGGWSSVSWGKFFGENLIKIRRTARVDFCLRNLSWREAISADR
jgi:hypothetical protein